MRSRFTDEHLREIVTRGFVVVPDAFEAEKVCSLKSSLETLINGRVFSGEDPRAIDNYMVHNPMFEDPIFFEMLANPTVLNAINSLLTDTGILYAFTTSSMPAGGTNFSNRIHVDCPRIIPNYITNIGIILALDDFTDINGATYFLPYSFERADEPSPSEFLAQADRVHPKAGDIVVFNARTWHLGGQNESANDRHALTINCCRSYMRQRFDYPRMADKLGIKTSGEIRRLLGYNVRVPVTMQEYYAPEGERLYLPGQG
jgi:ectoine hydroxylase-related dioxygenase (phytanoyl-CoA dioxygenase family)